MQPRVASARFLPSSATDSDRCAHTGVATEPEQLPRLSFHAGLVCAQHWPTGLRPPHGMQLVGDQLLGPARLRFRLRDALQEACARYRDDVIPGHQRNSLAKPSRPEDLQRLAGCTTTLRHSGFRGLLVGCSEVQRASVVAELAHAVQQPMLILTPDSAAAHRWRRTLTTQGLQECCQAWSVRAAAERMHWLGCRQDVLVVDAPELMPRSLLDRALEQCAALARIGFCGRADSQLLLHLGKGLGPVLAVLTTDEQPRCQQIRVAMPSDVAARYAVAWDTFLNAYDRFAATRADAGFGTFVAQARNDKLQRPALRAWHDALRLAAWHEHKAEVIRDLLTRHAQERLLLFTPDRKSAYELAREHLIPAITSEIPRGERHALLDAFANGTVRTLAGPRLLDLGVVERSADVAILVGGGFGRDQRANRCRRVRTAGVIYEIVSQATVEVGRAHRWRDPGSDAVAGLHVR